MSARVATWLAWVLCLLCVGLAVGSLQLGFLNGRTLGEIFAGEDIVMIATLSVAFSAVGALIASHRPANPIGWIFCAAALFQGLSVCGVKYATYALLTQPGRCRWGRQRPGSGSGSGRRG